MSLFSDKKELTPYGFISYMEDYIRRLLKDYKAQPDDYLKSYGITGPVAIEMLLKRTDPSDEDSAILKRKERISQEVLEPGDTRTPKDKFHIKYTIVPKDYWKKMKRIYDEFMGKKALNEEDGGAVGGDVIGGGATTSEASGQYTIPIKKKDSIIRRTIAITEEQLKYLKEEAVLDTMAGDFGYDAPASVTKKDDPTLDHSNIMKKSFTGYKKEDVNISK